jgi:hypothetical protein
MAWTIDSVIVQDNDVLTVNWSGIADASDLTDQVVVNLSDYTVTSSGATATTSQILSFKGGAGVGLMANLEWDHTTDDLILNLPPGLYIPMLPSDTPDERIALFNDPGTAGGTGDIVLTTLGGASGESVTLYMKILIA